MHTAKENASQKIRMLEVVQSTAEGEGSRWRSEEKEGRRKKQARECVDQPGHSRGYSHNCPTRGAGEEGEEHTKPQRKLSDAITNASGTALLAGMAKARE